MARTQEHQAAREFRLPRRRPGLGRRHHALCRPHAPADRHQHRRRLRPAEPEAAGQCRGAARLALAQGARRQRRDDRQPRAARGRTATPAFGGGLGIYDVSKPAQPRLITKWRTHGKGVHRYDFDGRYAYISPTAEGYVGNICMILDLKDPAKPEEVGRWWIPGQWKAGGEDYPWDELDAAALPPSDARAATGSMSATGTTATTSSTSPTCRSRSGVGRQHLAGLSASDPHLPADAAEAEGPRHHGGGGRGRGQAVAGAAGLHLDLRHHQRALPGADLDLAGARGWTRTARRSRR